MSAEYFETRADIYHDPRVILIKKMPGNSMPIFIFWELVYSHMDKLEQDERGDFAVICDGKKYDVAEISTVIDEKPSDVRQALNWLMRFDVNGIIAEYVRWPKA